MAGDNAGIGIGEIIDEEGGLRIGVNHLNPNDPYLTNDQKQALKRVGKTLQQNPSCRDDYCREEFYRPA